MHRKHRLMAALAAGALVAAMLPGTVTATPGNPAVQNFGQCQVTGGASGDEAPSTINPNGVHGPSPSVNERWFGTFSCNNHKL